ncbi:potassium/sodium hyperpolarization-activated cyclic nucleotide-gated channel 1 [Histomonas meleagridis]|uniref:potassium/sodium hyperpolarization-activated cyclic nucleotide-gated channel 1 n=1 Tax=Histomonas meleagridis TaxID=135588 RepID=UPI003559C3BF|nr:potassium/sodium hyperpolarization-activated cyclic nucleotide-gated channel 1 [Histomonas meleagridis]KAH0804174.1 potassium/sodium hyperpolarization-activated cyclic nucleotide-gated channel 1 [Histomonas meleagridis]
MTDEAPRGNFQPKFFELLNVENQKEYLKLRNTLSSHFCRNRRGKRIETFSETLLTIQNFCIRHNEDDWKRCLVCGICWIPNGIAINTRQLGHLIDKCKSSINGSFQKMGYTTLQSREESAAYLVEAIPSLLNNYAELREWTVRTFTAATPQPGLPPYCVNTIYPFASPAPQRPQFLAYPNLPPPRVPTPAVNVPLVTPQIFQESKYVSSPTTIQQIEEPIIDLMEDQQSSQSQEFETDNFQNDMFCLTPSFLIENDPNDFPTNGNEDNIFEENIFES